MATNGRRKSSGSSVEVHLWVRNSESIEAAGLELAVRTLSPPEQERRNRFHFPEDRRDYAIAHDLLRQSLSRYFELPPDDWMFDTGSTGKPAIRNQWVPPRRTRGAGTIEECSFSLSHTRGLVACAITWNMPVGVDVERTDTGIEVDEVAPHCLSDAEAEALDSVPRDGRPERFIELWTLKEAFVKATGQGLAQSPRSAAFEFTDSGEIEFRPSGGIDGSRWEFALYVPFPHARLAVAACRGARRVRFNARSLNGSVSDAIAPVRATGAQARSLRHL